MRAVLLATVVAVVLGSGIVSQTDLSVTVYNTMAYVKDTRTFNFDADISNVYFNDVAAQIVAETVTFTPKNHAGSVKILEQNFDANLVSSAGLTQKFIGLNVSLYFTLGTESRRLTGTLLGFDGSYIIENEMGVFVLTRVDAVDYPNLPEGFFTVPTLSWKVHSTQQFLNEPCQIVYRTTGFSWTADYTLIVSPDGSKGQFFGWVSIDNHSGKRYLNAHVKLVAGSVNTATPAPTMNYAMPMMAMAGAAAPSYKVT